MRRPHRPDWARYDDVAEAYDRYVVPSGYALLAKDLVTLMQVPPSGSVLDVGCGPGTGSAFAEDAVGPGGMVVLLDVSRAMLRRASRSGLCRLVAGTAPGLPFLDGVFDGVAASLVLSHFDRYEPALADMVRVLKPDGCLGVTTWAGRGPNEPRSPWRETAESFVGEDALRDAARQTTPWEDWFADPTRVAEALVESGLERVEVQQRAYRLSLTTEDYVARTETFTYGRFVRWRLGTERWEQFRRVAAEGVRAQYGDHVELTMRAHFGVGRRPCT